MFHDLLPCLSGVYYIIYFFLSENLNSEMKWNISVWHSGTFY